MDKKNGYSVKDSAVLFFVSIIMPQLVTLAVLILAGFIAYMFGGDINSFYTSKIGEIILCSITSLVFLGSLFYYTKRSKIDFVKAAHLNKKINYINVISGICIGIAAVVLFAPFINLVDTLLNLIGFVPSSDVPLLTKSVGSLLISIFVLAILPAVAEEFLFRGAIQNGLKKWGMWRSILATALLFTLMHGNPQQTVYQFMLGIIFGYAAYSSGSVWFSVLIHFVNNLFVVVLSYVSLFSEVATEAYELNAANIIVSILGLLIGIAVVYGIFAFNNKFSAKINNKAQQNIAIETPENTQAQQTEAQTLATDNYLLKQEKMLTIRFWIFGLIIAIALWVYVLVNGLLS